MSCGWCCCCTNNTDDYNPGIASPLLNTTNKAVLVQVEKTVHDAYLDLPPSEPTSTQPVNDVAEEYRDRNKYYVQWPYANLTKGMEVEDMDSDTENADKKWTNVRDSVGNISRVPLSYLTRVRDIKDEPWYFYNIESRDHAELVLKNSQEGDQIYLVRKCSNNSSPFVLSVKRLEPSKKDGFYVNHYQINKKGRLFGQEGEENFVSLSAMIDKYIETGFLSQPCIKQQIIEIMPKELTRGIELGRGEFGVVYKGTWRNYDVAVKEIVKGDSLADEIKLICQFNHPHIVTMYGANLKEMPHFMVMEFMCNGPLHHFVAKNSLQASEKVYILEQVSDGMRFLEKYKVIHRDLAARNILVGNQLCAKIADFGLSRNLKKDSVYYTVSGVKLPLLWLSLESLEDHVFTVRSDVWMFGILAMEVFTDGKRPYYDLLEQGLLVSDICQLIASGTRMSKPDSMPPVVYEQVLQCWEKRPEKRPTFNDLYMNFMRLKDETLPN